MNVYDPNHIPVFAYFILAVKVVIVNEDNQILLMRRSDKTSRAHGWDLPGGGVDKGEDPASAAIREVLEETALIISNPKLLTTFHGQTKGGEYVAIGYSASVKGSTIELSWEHEDYKWLSIDDLNSLELPALHATIIDAFIDAYSPHL